MNAQPDLFTPSGLRPMARTSDPETSHDAARRQDRDTLVYQWDMIVKALREHGPMNYSQIDIACFWDHPKAARRLHELVDQDRRSAPGARTHTHPRSRATAPRGSARQVFIAQVTAWAPHSTWAMTARSRLGRAAFVSASKD